MRFIGALFVALGVLALGYQGFTYIADESVASTQPIRVTAKREDAVWLPPVVGGIAVAGGVALIGLTSKRG